MKKTFCLILSFLMLLTLFAGCGNEPAAPATPADPATPAAPATPADPATPAEPAEPVDDTVYTLLFASTSAEGSAKNTQIELVLKDKLYEKSNGRLVLDIYSSNTLATSGEMLSALTSGIADVGWFLCPVYQGQFPYSDLFSTPGLSYGTIEETDAILREYSEAYPDALFSTDIKLCVRGSIGTQQLISTRPVQAFGDIAGLTCRVTSSQLEFYEAAGVAAVSMSASDVYEGLKLGTIEATVTGLEGMKRNKLAEVAGSATEIPMHVGEEAICMSWDTYNSLPADLQAVIDEAFKEMEPIFSAYTQGEEDAAKDDAVAINPDFKFYTLAEEDLAKLEAIGTEQMEAKAAELDAMGLDGTGALQWLRDHAK